MLLVDFTSLATMRATIERTIDDIDEVLTDLTGQLDQVITVWTGAAADGFQRSVADWLAGQRDLRRQLDQLHRLVLVAHGNHSQAVHANVALWRV
jgi:WXG100 family type VII secretion target